MGLRIHRRHDHQPGVYVPGTKMALFPGLPDAQQRADVLVFLRTKNDNPPPLPEATAAPPPRFRGRQAAPSEPAAGSGRASPLLRRDARCR